MKRFDDDDDDDDDDDSNETGNPYRLDSDETGGIKKMHLMQNFSCKRILNVLYSFLSGGKHSAGAITKSSYETLLYSTSL